MRHQLRLGVLASGRGSNLAAILEAIDRGDLHAQVVVVFSNNSKAGALELARSRAISAHHVSTRTHDDPDQAMLDVLRQEQVDVVVLAGYMKKIDPRMIAAFRDRIVNIHPAPLPRFGGPGMFGMAVHEAVLQAGVPSSGPTVHLVTEGYDEGRQLAHRPVAVRPDDTPESLAQRVLRAEHDLYWRVLEDHFAARAH